jgi:hypothetical protein
LAPAVATLAARRERCYIVTHSPHNATSRAHFNVLNSKQVRMPTHVHHHHNHPGEGHPAATAPPSILRMGAMTRLAAAAVAIVVIWGTMFWAMS